MTAIETVEALDEMRRSAEGVRVNLAGGLVAVIDEADACLVLPFKWSVLECNPEQPWIRYALTWIGPYSDRVRLNMHRLIMQPDKDQVVDHINGDTLDNRRANLRVCSRHDNARNARKRAGPNPTSKYIGVSWRPDCQKWRSLVTVNGRRKSVGVFSSEVDAAAAYDRAASLHYGEFARLNFAASPFAQPPGKE